MLGRNQSGYAPARYDITDVVNYGGRNALSIGTAWSLGAALLDRAHIRIDSLYVRFPIGLRIALDVVGLVPPR